MSKKLFSLVGGLLLISSGLSGQSFATKYDQPESQTASGERVEQSDNELSKLISDTIELAYKGDIIRQNVIVNKSGNVYLSVGIIPWKREGAAEALIGKNFKIDVEAFKQWMIKDRSIVLNSIQKSRILNKKTKKLAENILKLEQNGAYDKFIIAYVEEIIDDEIDIAKGEVAKVKKLVRRGDSFATKYFLK